MTFWTRDRVVDLAVKIDGWMDRDELGWLYDRAREVPEGGIWVEVGCWKGRSFFATTMGLPFPSEFHAVDTWGGDGSSIAHWEAREIRGWIVEHFRLAAFGLRSIRMGTCPLVVIYHGSLQEVSHLLPQGEIDGAFVDGLHDYNSVGTDIDSIYPKIKLGGLLAGHDFHLESVQQAVQERFSNVQLGAKNIWYARKEASR